MGFLIFLILGMIFRNRKEIDTTQLDMFFDSIEFEGTFAAVGPQTWF